MPPECLLYVGCVYRVPCSLVWSNWYVDGNLISNNNNNNKLVEKNKDTKTQQETAIIGTWALEDQSFSFTLT